jgi:phosphoribosyl 1,2-cyclic phosphate phosphodiesterase
MKVKVTFLGTGTSVGIPMIGCSCEVCTSSNPQDQRLRNSALVNVDGKNILIDCGPDFRQQMLREKVTFLDAILITHIHNDHTIGMDDIRPYNFMSKKDMPLFTDAFTAKEISNRFDYIFGPSPYPGAPSAEITLIDKNTPFDAVGVPIIPIEVIHGKLPTLGFRFDNFAYLTDVKTIAPEELEKLKGVEYLAINALQQTQHHAHLTLEEALDIIDQVKPLKAYLTHVSHKMGKAEEVSKILPEGVMFAYDGLSIECN